MFSIYFLSDRRAAYKGSKSVPLLADLKYKHGEKSEHFRFSTGVLCNPRSFRDQTIWGSEPNAEQKNVLLRKIRTAAERIYLDGVSRGELPDKATFKQRILASLTDTKTEKTTLDYLDDYTMYLTVKKRSASTVAGIKRLREIMAELRDVGVSIQFEDINALFETRFRHVLNERGYNVNTIGSYIKRLKVFLNWALKNNLHQNLIFKNFDIDEVAREIVALSETEIEAIAGLHLPTHKNITKGIKLTRDWFIVSTQTGLRYSDLHKVTKEAIRPADGGFDLIITETKKTKAKVVIPISRLLYKTLKAYNFAMPAPPSNQKYNENLKEIAKRAEIEKTISSHTGRKSFCTIQYRKGVPVAWLMKISGHKTEKEFYKYIGVDLSENAALVRERNTDFQINPMSA